MGVGSAGASNLTEQIAAIIDRYPGGIKMVDSIEFLVAWARANSLWPLVYGTACCAMEMMSAGSSRHDWARFGVEVARATPRQADLIVLAGTIVEKMGKNLVTLYEQMAAPKYVIAMGSCAISGGPFYYDAYSVIKGGDRLIPVDVYVPGCPPRPEALLYGIMELQEKIKKEGRRNPWKIGDLLNTPFVDTYTTAKKTWAVTEKQKDSEEQAAREQFKLENPDFKPPKAVRLKKEKFDAIPRTESAVIGISNRVLLQSIQTKFPDVTVFREEDASSEQILDLVIPPENYTELIQFLKDDEDLGLDLFLQLSAVDWKDHFDVLVHLLSTRDGHKLFLRCRVEKENAKIDTISQIFRGAEWHEREVYDLFGVQFRNHPDMRRIFLNNDFPGHPLCKDFEDPTRVVKRPY